MYYLIHIKTKSIIDICYNFNENLSGNTFPRNRQNHFLEKLHIRGPHVYQSDLKTPSITNLLKKMINQHQRDPLVMHSIV